jgi:hypothetical protein
MSHLEMQPVKSQSARTEAMAVQHRPDRTERRLRRTSAWLMLFFLFQGSLGAVWDREWHAYVGRDQFWTPPHTLIYSCVSGAGLIALFMVLFETYRYQHKAAGVNDESTISIFRFFHAPLGSIVTGFGALIALIAAPLDNYWHELYGIDIALWAPFHMMGVTGGLIGMLGIVYVFASEAALDRQASLPTRRFLGLSALEWGALMVIAIIMNFTLTGFLQFPLITIGPLQISTYPLPLITGAVFCFVGANRLTERPGVATIVVAFLLLNTLAVEIFVPWAIRTAVAQQGLDYRMPGHIPYFSIPYAILPLALLPSALVIDGTNLWNRRKHRRLGRSQIGASLLGLLVTPPIALLAPLILSTYSSYAPIFLPEPGLTVPPAILWPSVLGFSLAMLLAGAVGALFGNDFGDVWRWNTR